ncbi:uncharacterized protein LOC118745857 [Rhagoletis pomonella]|uniref:uncharacterized protein LOC118745857 n=1 Tax=Rhagoletis pomonella TaxID=28610 RepID=UPI00178002AB|nr:uncharacterized protein LOC118745857 [Rhagoletis pomonella]
MVNQRVALPTAVVKASNTNTTGATVCKALMDSASMGTFVSEDIVQRLRLSRRNGRIKVGGIGEAKSVITRGIVSLQLTSRFDSNVSVNIDAFILNRISHQDKSDPVNMSHCSFPPNLNMADDGSLISQPIDVLIGPQHFFDFLTDGKFTSTGFSTIQNIIFGYVLAGKVHNGGEDICSYSVTASINDFKVDQASRRFWETENEPQVLRKLYTPEEQFCENHFQKTHGYDDAGRYIVKLPFRDDSPRLGDSYTSARKQFASLERRFERDESLFNQYKAFMEEYIALGHMEKIPASEVNKSCEKVFYLPHHPVLKPDSRSTKCRVVFNGSAKSASGAALNDLLAVGPTIQRDLTSLLLNFRRYRIGLCGDIVKMYRQVLVHHDDRDYQRILWRTSAAQPISHYRLRTVTYGTATAPFLATRCLYATGKDADEPQTGFMIKNNFYVDDLIAGATSVEEAINLKADITKTLAIRGFPLSKWVSNDLSIIQNVDMQTSDVDIAEIDTESSLKILGLQWQPLKDCFTFKVAPVVNACTKRVILSESSKIYDDIPVALSQSWLTFRQNYACFNSLRIPRWVHTSPRDKFQLCGF